MAKGAGFELSSTELLLAAGVVAALLFGTGEAVKPLSEGVGGGIRDVTGIIPFLEHQLTDFEAWVSS